jgi:hypothetical protein
MGAGTGAVSGRRAGRAGVLPGLAGLAPLYRDW